jgi:hypothetical protein
VPANRVHAFRVVGDQPLVTFGIHTFGDRQLRTPAVGLTLKPWRKIIAAFTPVRAGLFERRARGRWSGF